MFILRLAHTALASLLLAACATAPEETEPAQDVTSILLTFEALRMEMALPKVRLSLQTTEMFAYASESTHLVLDEQFAGQLSNAALRYVLVHELEHLKNRDPKNGHDILKRIHQDDGAEGDTRFLTLVGRYGQHHEFQTYVREAEARANVAAIEYIRSQGEDPCQVVREIEFKTKVKFAVGVESACPPPTPAEAPPGPPIEYPSDDSDYAPSWEEPVPFEQTGEGLNPSASEPLP